MKTLADEMLGILTIRPVPLSVVVARLGVSLPDVRRTAGVLNDDGCAILVRRRRILHLVSAEYPMPVCKNCFIEFDRPKTSRRRCCSRTCSIAWSWTRPGVREKRVAGILVDRARPEAKARLAAHNERRWSRPGEREKMSEQNRREWSDPVKHAARSASIRAVNGSTEFRKLCSDIRKAYWQDPETRDKMLAAVRAGRRTPEAKAKQSAATKRRYSEPASRERYLEVSRQNIAKATAAITGKKQPTSQVIARVAATKKTRLNRRQ